LYFKNLNNGNRMALVTVIKGRDLSDNEIRVIGVATNRENALRMINEYYGEESVMTNFKDIREDNIDFSCTISVSGLLGGVYRVWGEDYEINNL
jgi:hypothetical protein